MNTEQNTLPLWKKLNEKRTQGTWMQYANKVVTETKSTLVDYDTTIFINNQILENRIENAQYTALAVNNFTKVCEALEDSKKVIEEIYWLLHDNKETIDLPPTFNCSSDVLGRLFLAMNEAKLLLNNIK